MTSIGDPAFEYCDQLESIAIPDTLTHIGDSAFNSTWALRKFDLSPEHPVFEVVDGVLFNKRTHTLLCCPAALEVGDLRVTEGTLAIAPHAFANCRYLTGVTLPDGLGSIGKFAFTGCRSLQRVALPDSLTTIGHSAFHACTALTDLTVSPDNDVFTITDGMLIDKRSKTVLHYLVPDSRTRCKVPMGIRTIASHAFAHCGALTAVDLPHSFTTIGFGAFSGCSHLSEVIVREGLTTIESHAFAGLRGPDLHLPAAQHHRCRR